MHGAIAMTAQIATHLLRNDDVELMGSKGVIRSSECALLHPIIESPKLSIGIQTHFRDHKVATIKMKGVSILVNAAVGDA